MKFDVVIVGGGPAGLQAALTLGRSRKRVLLCDAGPRRNAAAAHMHNFLTRDGTPPAELRAIARQQLAHYPNVEVQDVGITSITGARGEFRVALTDGGAEVTAHRILLATGMIDQPPVIEGLGPLWGHSIVQCPFCHGWEARDRRWGYLALPATAAHLTMFATMLRSWTRDVTVFTGGAVNLTTEAASALTSAGIRIETAAIARLIGDGPDLQTIALTDGRTVPCDLLLMHPPQRQLELVRTLGPTLDADGFVRVESMRMETSIPGIYAAGDLITRGQAAILAAAAGMQAAAAINADLTMDLAQRGALG